MEGITEKVNKNGFTTIRLHYTAVPKYRKPAWLVSARRGYTNDRWEQEMEINFTLAGTHKVYPDFSYEKHVRKLRPLRELGLLVGWDYGYHHPAIVICQIDPFDRLVVLDEMLGSNITIQKFTKIVIEYLKKNYAYWWNKKTISHFGDPAGRQVNDKSEYTSMQIQKQLGIFVRWKDSSIKEGVRVLQHIMMERAPDEYGFKVDPRCKILIDGFQGGYVEEPQSGNKQMKELPYPDDYYSHNQDALRYVIVNKFPSHGRFHRKGREIVDAGVYNPFHEEGDGSIDRQSRITGYR